MPEQPLLPREERITLREAAEIAGKTTKAMQQLVSRRSINFAREGKSKSGRASRVVTTRAWVEEYLAGTAFGEDSYSGARARVRDRAPTEAAAHVEFTQGVLAGDRRATGR